MVCSFCSNKNIPTSVVCSNCGVILRLAKSDRKEIKRKIKTSTLWRIFAIVIAAILAGSVGHVMVSEILHIHRSGGTLIGALFGAALVYIVSTGRFLLLSNLYRMRYVALQTRIKGTLSSAEQRYEDELRGKTNSSQARFHLATAHLLQNEVERSVQEFQQVQLQDVPEVEYFNNAGVALAKRGNIQQSIELFERAAGKNGHAATPHANLAHAYTRASETHDMSVAERAIQEIEKTLSLDGKKPAQYNRLGIIFCQQKKIDEAVAQFRRALELSGESRSGQADVHNNIGVAYCYRGDLREAAQEFQSALRLDPSHGRALCNQGVLRMLQKNYAAALEPMEIAHRLDSKSVLVRNNYGVGLSRFDAVNEGIREFKEAILLDSNTFEPYYNLGKIYTDEKVSDVAERYLVRALQLHPQSWETLTVMGTLKLSLGQVPQAIQYLKSAEQLKKGEPSIMVNLGICLALNHDYEEADSYLRGAAELEHDNAVIAAHLGWLHLLTNNVSESASESLHAIEQNQFLAPAHNNYGLCEISLGDYDTALKHFRLALNIDPDLAKAYYHIGYVYALQKNTDMAIKQWQEAAKHEPGYADCYVNLGVGYYLKGSLDLAVLEFRRVLVIRQDRMADYSNLALTYAKQGVILRKASRNPSDLKDPKAKEAIEKARLAVEMFDRALTLDPNNAMLHSNRGLACFFANRPEDAMEEWTTVTRLDPIYAKRRGAAQQTEFDETSVSFVSINISERGAQVPLKTPDFMHQFVWGYNTDEWEMILDDPALARVPEMVQRSYQIERSLQALKV